MEEFTWFDILFYATYNQLQLNKKNYEKLSKVSKEISDTTGSTSKRESILYKFLVETGQFRDLQTSKIKKYVEDDELRKKINDRIRNIYNDLKDVKLDSSNA